MSEKGGIFQKQLWSLSSKVYIKKSFGRNLVQGIIYWGSYSAFKYIVTVWCTVHASALTKISFFAFYPNFTTRQSLKSRFKLEVSTFFKNFIKLAINWPKTEKNNKNRDFSECGSWCVLKNLKKQKKWDFGKCGSMCVSISAETSFWDFGKCERAVRKEVRKLETLNVHKNT